MLQWWIILSPITSAKSVKLLFSPSYSAQVLASVTVLVMTWAVVASPIPLIASVVLLNIIYSRPVSQFLPEPLVGNVEIDFDGDLCIQDKKVQFNSISDIYAFAFISFQGRTKRWILWRDSCDDVIYRQLLVRLRQKQEH